MKRKEKGLQLSWVGEIRMIEEMYLFGLNRNQILHCLKNQAIFVDENKKEVFDQTIWERIQGLVLMSEPKDA